MDFSKRRKMPWIDLPPGKGTHDFALCCGVGQEKALQGGIAPNARTNRFTAKRPTGTVSAPRKVANIMRTKEVSLSCLTLEVCLTAHLRRAWTEPRHSPDYGRCSVLDITGPNTGQEGSFDTQRAFCVRQECLSSYAQTNRFAAKRPTCTTLYCGGQTTTIPGSHSPWRKLRHA